ncbi:MAG: transposase [Verrucomicrobiae bacterium]|nr:transposase [Verrucomicrobiae bacterium]
MAAFSDQPLSDNAGSWLLRTIDHGLGMSRKLVACFTGTRYERFVEHPLEQLLAQRPDAQPPPKLQRQERSPAQAAPRSRRRGRHPPGPGRQLPAQSSNRSTDIGLLTQRDQR